MIARLWRGVAVAGNADAYHRHATTKVFPALRDIAGHRGAYLLKRTVGGRTEFLAVTFWDSLDAIRAFAGDDPEAAVVEPEARAVLAEFDDFARHYEVAGEGVSAPPSPAPARAPSRGA
jgi:heme-degrading monooxygenase HmoA